MLKRTYQILIRATLLSTIIVLGITIIFPGWYDNRYIIIDEITAKFMSIDDLQIRERARQKGVPFGEYKKEVLAKRLAKKHKAALTIDLENSIRDQDSEALREILLEFKKSDLPQNIYALVIQNNFIHGIELIHQYGIPCTTPEETLRDKKIISSPHLQTLNAALTSTPEIFEKWIELECYRPHRNIEVRLTHNSDFSRFLMDISHNDKDNEFWEKLLWESISKKKENIYTILIDRGVTVSKKILQAKIKKRHLESDDFLTTLIKQRKIDIASRVLDRHPNYIGDRILDQEIFDAIKNGQQHVSTYSAVPSSLLRLDRIEFDALLELRKAVQQGNLARIVWLLKLDPTIHFSMINAEITDQKKLDRSIRSSSIKDLPLLLQRGLDLNVFQYKGVDQLSDAVSLGEVDIVELLLESDVKPDRLYRGKSILDTQTSQKTENSQKIRDLLIAKGAHNNLGKLVRKETGVKYNPQCKIGEASVRQYATKPEYLSVINEGLEKGLNADNYGLCHVGLLLCTKSQENSLDDCFESAPACTTSNGATRFSKDNPATNLCCPQEAKSRYNEMRCSGLGVIAASFALKDMGFPTTYTIPTFMVNTPEYQKHIAENEPR